MCLQTLRWINRQNAARSQNANKRQLIYEQQNGDTHMKLLILGATSAIAQEALKPFAKERADFFLVARDKVKLAAVAGDLRTRGAGKVEEYPADLNNLAIHQNLIDTALANLNGIDIILIAYGTLSNQEACQGSVDETLREFTTNCLSIISLLTRLANYCEQQRHGCIAVISSVAGDRGRKSNYVYGTAKGALSIFLQGLRNRLMNANVQVITVKPGFVNTPMTKGLQKNALFAEPEFVGKKIYQAIKKRQDIVYVPGFWRLIMFGIRCIPERIFKSRSL